MYIHIIIKYNKYYINYKNYYNYYNIHVPDGIINVDSLSVNFYRKKLIIDLFPHSILNKHTCT